MRFYHVTGAFTGTTFEHGSYDVLLLGPNVDCSNHSTMDHDCVGKVLVTSNHPVPVIHSVRLQCSNR